MIKSKDKLAICFLVIMILGSLLRIYDLGKRELWYDETYSITLAKQSIAANIENLQNNQPPLYQIILHFWIKFFGDDKITVRSLSVIFGLISIWIAYEISYLLFGQKTALLSSFLLAISNFHIHYSQETRDYALFAMLTLLSFFFLIKLLQSNKPKFFIYYFITTAFLYYAHNYALFIIFAQNLYFLLRLKKYKELKSKWFFTQAGAFALFALWLPSLFKQMAKKHFIISIPYVKNIIGTLNVYIDLGKTNGVLLVFLLISFIALLLIKKEKQPQLSSVAITTNDAEYRFKFEKFDKVILLSLWLACPVLIPFVISKVYLPIYAIRYTICASMAFYIIIARLISDLR